MTSYGWRMTLVARLFLHNCVRVLSRPHELRFSRATRKRVRLWPFPFDLPIGSGIEQESLYLFGVAALPRTRLE